MNDDQMVPYEITTATDRSATGEALFADQVFAARMVVEQEQATADERDALLITVAQEVGADLLITERASLLDTRLLQSGNCQVAAPADALALVALYLRAAGQFIDPRLFYEIVLPWRAAFSRRRVAGAHSPPTRARAC